MKENKCQFYLIKKKKQCQFDFYKDQKYCHHHMNTDEVMICPVDNTHTIFRNTLDKHLKICTKQKQQLNLINQQFYQKNVNSQQYENQFQIQKVQIKQLQNDQSIQFMDFLIKLEQEFIKSIQQLQFDNELPIDFQQKEISETQKNQQQGQDLINMMKNSNLINSSHIYIEFGAGKGYFSHIVSQETNNESNHVLLEIESRRNKYDKHHDQSKYKRITMDINDFKINSIPQIIQIDQYDIIGISKHMCGVATDLAIQTLLNCNNQNVNFHGMIIATCCHHKCNFNNYINKPYLQQKFNDLEIQMLFSVSSWAVETNNKKNKVENQFQNKDSKISNFYNELNSVKKSQFGFMSKRIIDIGRCLHIQNQKNSKNLNYTVKYQKYSNFEITPENFVIIVEK